ncbi:SgcJ/EcaC family oxidoreductase [Streptomyces sp. AN091965]|uniref:SgcJ/EcaC family oxidoreductase n=1 Tax=Streptomyces sp. AN091965 TaxID=2927803 RepID=UPI001F6164E7|nr:SgcJ/EcaC family oxidoreductase [Streptomyces sp. AN091965]MCI3934969.1 SgcJ/EcaC family oxidoreductase [Streptomyces sp. AN091965]
MKVLLTGATGYIGSAVTEHLAAAGHQVVALTRSAEPQSGRPWHAQLIGDTADPASLAGAVTPDIEAVIHLAPPSGDADVDSAVIEALATPLRGTGRPLVYTSGVWVLGATGDAQEVGEEAPTNPIGLVGYRPQIEQRVLAEAAEGVRAVVVRPAIAYGRGGGIPALLVDRARKEGVPEYYGEEGVRWPTVHVDDLAELFVAAVERAEAGTVWHGVGESAVAVRDVAQAAGRAAGVLAAPRVVPVEQGAEVFGALFADALALDQSVSGAAARTALGWRPARPGMVAELTSGSYRPIEVFGAPEGPETDAEVAAIRRLVAEVEHAQQNELADRFLAVFRQEGPVWTTGHGKRLSGFEEIAAFTRKVLPGATAESTAVYDVERVLFLKPDVAAVNVRQQPVLPDGTRIADRPEGRPFYILVKEDGTWRVGAAQNTLAAG